MDKGKVIEIVRDYKTAISDFIGPSRVFLYGSYSKGCAREDSDIDVAVVVPKLDGDWFFVVPKLWKASRKINSFIEPVLIEECNPSPLWEEIQLSGIAV